MDSSERPVSLFVHASNTTVKKSVHFAYFWRPLMPVRYWQVFLLSLFVLCGISGCGGNYKFNDDTYRPLGDPQAVNRGK